MRYSEHEQRQMDIKSGEELDRHAERKAKIELDGKLYAAVLHTITVLHFERLNAEQRAYLADAIVREITLRKIV